MWDAIIWPNGEYDKGPEDVAECRAWQQGKVAAWDEVLSTAHDGTRWLTSADLSACVATSRWWNAMLLREFERAETEVLRALSHHESHCRSNRADLVIKLNVARLAAGREREGVEGLLANLSSGIYRPSMIANSTIHELHWIGPILSKPFPVGDPTRQLLRALGEAKKIPKGWIKKADQVSDWAGVEDFLSYFYK